MVELVSAGGDKTFRPDISDIGEEIKPVIIEEVKKCWEENPDNRPNFPHIVKTIKDLNKGR